MINNKRVLAVIPARGGSKGVLRKNIRPLAGKPLIAWTIEAARQSRYIDYVAVSSEDIEIIDVARAWGAEIPFVRPASLACDETLGIEPVMHAISELPGYDYVVLLQPTSPLRVAADIDACLKRCNELGAPSCVSVVEPDHHPFWMFQLDHAGRLEPLFPDRPARRQDLPPVFALNGAVYVADTKWLKAKKSFLAAGCCGYPMPMARSIDIDTIGDFQHAEQLLEERKTNRQFTERIRQ